MVSRVLSRGRMAGLAAAAVLVLSTTAVAQSAGAQTTPVADLPPAAQPKPASTEIWRAIKDGQKGKLANPEGGAEALIKPIVPGCTEKAVGFTTPVHAVMPPIVVPQGQGASLESMALLAVVFGLAAGAGAMLARNLGRHDAAGH